MNQIERDTVLYHAGLVPKAKKIFWSYYMRNRRLMRRAGGAGFIGSAAAAHKDLLYHLNSN
jgi:hypothetical protein